VPLEFKKEITQPIILLAEGDGDAAFFAHLCGQRGIANFQIEAVQGKDNFGNYALGLMQRPGFKRIARCILFVGDNDETPDASFQSIRRQLGRVDLPQPNNPREKLQRDDGPFVVIQMLPFPALNGSWHGSLESMLLVAADQQHPQVSACARTYSQCVNTAGWPRTARDKLLLRCMFSGLWRQDPNASLQKCLSPDRGLVPLGHNAFDEISRFLATLEEWLQSNVLSWDAWIDAH
jgi:hypothetical protein